MRAKLLAITADVPEPLIAIGATSRLDPQPKFVPATMMSPGFMRERVLGIESFERVLAELGLIDDVAVLSRNDHVGVDVLSVFVRVTAQRRFHRYAPFSTTVSPSTEPALSGVEGLRVT